MNKKTVRDIDVKGKKVLVRCDFNVPLDENKNITDNRRIVGALPTIKYLLYNDQKAKKEYQNLLIIIFSILLVIYYHFAKDSYEDVQKLNNFDSNKKKTLTKFLFVASLLILISGIIFLGLAITDDDIDIELAFN